ncbi:Chaperone protein DnaJ 1 [Camellia lanceoleosa]|uniref:Chaperone protein DnaJ 1 n=1 Tax=Camellia lanceoleosa TaxID=1840588 RepID=A0ACC0FB43_9ERIC|nr:Chaperone protein DnaJ 1 [Camellia lanceoleosa]
MECNKNDAVRAKEIAEQKLKERDFAGAKKFALKAQKLFPMLEGLPQFMATLDVYISAETKINGEVDWYGVLGVNPLADTETLRRHYRKLYRSLHPDKSVGVKGAFKIIAEALTLLSDKAKREAYDQKRNLSGIYKKNETGNSSTPTNNDDSSVKDQKSAASPRLIPIAPRPSKPNTFWTACNRCKIQYEHLRDYLNQKVRCPNCHEPCYAVEMPAPPKNGPNPTTSWPFYQQQQQNVNRHLTNNTSASNMLKLGSAGVGSIKSPNIASMKMSARLASNAGSTSGPMKKSRIQVNVTGREMLNQMAVPNQKVCLGTESLNTSGTVKNNSVQEMSQLEIRNLLMAKSQMEIRKKLNEWNKKTALEASIKEGKKMVKEKPNGGKKDGNKNAAFVDTNNSVQPRNSSLVTSNIDFNEKAAETKSMSVLDPDFYEFDKDRAEESFGENQVWAAYDDDDGMPRYYALIHNLISMKPFKVQISWLNSKSNAELGPLNWIGSGFSKTSGDFRLGKHVIFSNLNSFSDRVKWMKGKRGVIQIFPRKGDIWALYSNWSPDWNVLTPNEVVHKYDVVEVLEDYNKERGVVVAPLVKVAGFKSVFHQNSDLQEVKTIPREEMFCFSHQVPSYMLTDQEAKNAPKGCRELDTAAIPPELLKVITEAKEVETVEKAKKATKKDDGVESFGKVQEDLDLEESGKSTAQEGMIEDFKNIDTKAKSSNAKESEEEEIVKDTNEGRSQGTNKAKRW